MVSRVDWLPLFIPEEQPQNLGYWYYEQRLQEENRNLEKKVFLLHY
jgi:hypothetical protein